MDPDGHHPQHRQAAQGFPGSKLRKRAQRGLIRPRQRATLRAHLQETGGEGDCACGNVRQAPSPPLPGSWARRCDAYQSASESPAGLRRPRQKHRTFQLIESSGKFHGQIAATNSPARTSIPSAIRSNIAARASAKDRPHAPAIAPRAACTAAPTMSVSALCTRPNTAPVAEFRFSKVRPLSTNRPPTKFRYAVTRQSRNSTTAAPAP